MEKQTIAGNAAVPSSSNQRPSVPISVYRELATELQETQEMVNVLKNQNHLLTEENRQLRQEFEKVRDKAIHLQQAIADFQQVGAVEQPPEVSEPIPLATDSEGIVSEQYYIEQPQHPSNPSAEPPRGSKLNALWLFLAIVAIVLAAFGAGFFITRTNR